MHKLPDHLRPLLARPFAPVLTTEQALSLARLREVVVSVGDVVTQMFLDAGIIPRLMVVDGVTQRMQTRASALQNLPTSGVTLVEVENPAATITNGLHDAVVRGVASKGPTLIHVLGEEDLAALPALLHAPEGALVCYGQPPGPQAPGGVVAVAVDEEVRERARVLLNQMEVK